MNLDRSASLSSKTRVWTGLTVVLAVVGSVPGHLRGQDTPPATRVAGVAEPPNTAGWSSYSVAWMPWTTVVSLTVALPAGSQHDPEGREGTAWLLGETVRSRLAESLVPPAADVSVEVDRAHTTVRVLTTPAGWVHALGIVERVVFEVGMGGDEELDRARAHLHEVFTFESGTPVSDFELELHRTLSSLFDPWSRDPRGSPASIDMIGVADLEAYRAERYDRSRATLAIAGPASPAEVGVAVAGFPIDAGTSTHTVRGVAPAGSPTDPLDVAWTSGDRLSQVRDVTSGWVAIAFPVSADASPTALDFILHRLRGRLLTQPPAPGLFSADLRLTRIPTGHTVLLVVAAVLPEAMRAWENRILRAMTELREEDRAAPFFNAHRRRYRNTRLLADAAPEEQSLRLAMDLLERGQARDLPSEIDALSPPDVEAALAGLGAPRILLFGPDLGGS